MSWETDRGFRVDKCGSLGNFVLHIYIPSFIRDPLSKHSYQKSASFIYNSSLRMFEEVYDLGFRRFWCLRFMVYGLWSTVYGAYRFGCKLG